MAAAGPRGSSDGGPASRGGDPAGENNNDRGGAGGSGGGSAEADRATFECNICLDTARDAVISMCGHLFWYEEGRWGRASFAFVGCLFLCWFTGPSFSLTL